jgi:hypothetical protein
MLAASPLFPSSGLGEQANQKYNSEVGVGFCPAAIATPRPKATETEWELALTHREEVWFKGRTSPFHRLSGLARMVTSDADCHPVFLEHTAQPC